MSISAPDDRSGFTVAVICALPIEAECVLAVLDQRWDRRKYGQLEGDINAYTTGAIGGHNVVLVHMPGMGTVSAAGVAALLRMSFPSVQFALLVGVCGGVPRDPMNGFEIVLGDVIVSSLVVQYDLGREYTGGFQIKTQREDSLGRASPSVRSVMNMLKTSQYHHELENKTAIFLHDIQNKVPATKDPGPQNDHLFDATYQHRHRNTDGQHACENCERQQICESAIASDCRNLGCEEGRLVLRDRLHTNPDRTITTASRPSIFFKPIASGNKVVKSAEERDRLAHAMGVGAFEMEGAGVWDYVPSIVVKGVCDYADCHKNKRWQNFAAATAAACAKAILLEWPVIDVRSNQRSTSSIAFHTRNTAGSDTTTPAGVSTVPFSYFKEFIGRRSATQSLKTNLFTPDGPRRAAIVGPAGVGKTRLALEIARIAQSQHAPCSVFWVQATDALSVEGDMLKIGKALCIAGIEDGKADVKSLVKQRLSQTSTGSWLFILDNADDAVLWDRDGTLVDYLPESITGSVLVTTRSRRVGHWLTPQALVELTPMNADEAVKLLRNNLDQSDVTSSSTEAELLAKLGYLPLAITQAAAYMTVNGNSAEEYLDLLRDSEENVVELLDEDFRVDARYLNGNNSTLSTWLVSFEEIQRQNELAAEYLSFLSCLNENQIPKSLLVQGASPKKTNDAVGLLKAYHLISQQGNNLSMHGMVRLATRNWLRRRGTISLYMTAAMTRLNEKFPPIDHDHKSHWKVFLPHAQALCESKSCNDLAMRYALLEKIGGCLLLDGKYNEAVTKLELVAQWGEQKSSNLDPCIWKTYDKLGEALEWAGEWGKAETYHSFTLARRIELLGSDDPETLRNMARLASVYCSQMKWEQSKQLNTQTVSAMTRVLGENDPDTLDCVELQAYIRLAQNQFAAAEELLLPQMDVRRRMFGHDHPKTLNAMAKVAMALSGQGRLDEAITLEEKIVAISQRVLGDHHPETLIKISNLAMTYGLAGRWHSAETLLEQITDVHERLLGKAHPHTLIVKTQLCGTYAQLWKWDEAIAMLKPIIEKSFGPDPLQTPIDEYSLSNAYRTQERYEEAAEPRKMVLNSRHEELGSKTTDMLSSMSQYARLQNRMGNLNDACKILAECVNLSVLRFGKDDPKTRIRMETLVKWSEEKEKQENKRDDDGNRINPVQADPE